MTCPICNTPFTPIAQTTHKFPDYIGVLHHPAICEQCAIDPTPEALSGKRNPPQQYLVGWKASKKAYLQKLSILLDIKVKNRTFYQSTNPNPVVITRLKTERQTLTEIITMLENM